MTTFKKISVLLVLVTGIGISCEQELAPSPTDRLTDLTRQVVSSSKFAQLAIPLNDLHPAGSQFVNADRNSIYIPFKSADTRKGVLAQFGNGNELLGVFQYEMKTDITPDRAQEAYKNKEFSGDLTVQSEFGELKIALEKSKPVSSKFERASASGRVADCLGATDAIRCAESRLEKMSIIEAALCYADFIICMTQLIASCLLSHCDVSPQVSP